MSVSQSPSFRDHEQVVFCYDAAVGLNAIIAIHNTTLGPALGGLRMWPYDRHACENVDVEESDILASMSDLCRHGVERALLTSKERTEINDRDLRDRRF